MSSGSIEKLTANIKAGGCAAKLSPMELAAILRNLPVMNAPELLTGLSGFEDAAVYRISEEIAIIQTLDFFPPVVDDPVLYGRIAAANALSDVYAMGGRPILALNILGFPTCDYPLEIASKIIEGGAQAVLEAGAVLAGGHSIQSKEPIYGMSVTGLVHPKKILTNAGAKIGDKIIITKAIGSGVSLLAIKGELLDEAACNAVYASISKLNADALNIALRYKINGATDVTGFGLIGHVHEMASASKVAAIIETKSIPFLPNAINNAAMGLVPAGAYANRNSYSNFVMMAPGLEVAMADLLYDPQTSGGLLLSCADADSNRLIEDLHAAGCTGEIIGQFVQGTPGNIEVK